MDLRDFVSSRAHHDIDDAFLKNLTGLPQTLLSAEQTQVEAQLEVVTSAYQALGSKHSTDFVSGYSSLSLIRSLVGNMGQATANAAEAVSSVPRASERGFAEARQLADQELQLYLDIGKIQELLQLPELVRTCAAGQQYAAALDLAGLAGRLRGRYPSIATVNRVADEVDASVDQIRLKLEQSLRESSRLPQLIKVVSLLRRVQFHRESEDLQRLFISSRQQFLIKQWENVPNIKKFVDLYREHVFATISGHRAIFEGELQEHALAEFVRWATDMLLAKLREVTQQQANQDRSALWLQLAFCSHSLGRVGVSFWPLIGAILVPEGVLTVDEWREAQQRQQEMARQAAKLSIKT